ERSGVVLHREGKASIAVTAVVFGRGVCQPADVDGIDDLPLLHDGAMQRERASYRQAVDADRGERVAGIRVGEAEIGGREGIGYILVDRDGVIGSHRRIVRRREEQWYRDDRPLRVRIALAVNLLAHGVDLNGDAAAE